MSRFARWTLVAAALAACLTAGTVARPAVAEEQHGESAAADTQFGRALRDRLTAMSVGQLSALHTSLAAGASDPAGRPDDDGDDNDDDEMMMGDMPSTADDPSPPPSPAGPVRPDDADGTLNRTRESAAGSAETADGRHNADGLPTPNRNLMIHNIQMKVMNFVGLNGRTLSSPSPLIKPHMGSPSSAPVAVVDKQQHQQQTDALRALYENANNAPALPVDPFTEKTQSFYPSCEIPKHANEEAWNSRESMNLVFNITFPRAAANGVSMNISSAKLRLFKQLVSCNSQTSNETTDDSPICQPNPSEEITKRLNTSSSAEIPLMIIEDKQIRVSIYAYTRLLKKRRVKRKLLDSHMLPYYSEKWTEWNIRSAVKSWRRDPIRNYGISIEVEDEDGNLLPVSRFFQPMNCTGDAQTTIPKPIPGFLVEAAHRGYGPAAASAAAVNTSALQAFGFNVHRYPMVDVTTVEVPDSAESRDAAFLYHQYAKYAFEHQHQHQHRQQQQQPAAGPDQIAEMHRIRHGGGGGNSRHRDGAQEVNGGDDGDDEDDEVSSEAAGRQFRDKIIVQGILYRNPKGSGPASDVPEPSSS